MKQPRLYRKTDVERLVKDAVSPATEKKWRSTFRKDYGRLVHGAAFRRLQGKTQLFPSHESDFFRNRLTHSIEVAQIAKSIANKVNATHDYFIRNPVDTDLVEFAALAHDLGHPPFGHNGEEALDECMHDAGGFEGNAQTLRILVKLEKHAHFISEDATVGEDDRAGLNLCYRTLASILKYDQEIPRMLRGRSGDPGPVKGYYFTESSIVKKIRKKLDAYDGRKLRTIECSIMDIADDIAYSTYDLEDSFKGYFLSPAKMIMADVELASRVCATIAKRAERYYEDLPASEREFTTRDFYAVILEVFKQVLSESIDENIFAEAASDSRKMLPAFANLMSASTAVSENIARNGYNRKRFTSELVKSALDGIEVVFDDIKPHLSVVRLNIKTFRQVETLKNFVFETLIMSPMLKVAEYRGKDIVKKIFDALMNAKGHELLPEDFRVVFDELKEPDQQKRVVCDFISGMTDRYAIQFYNRLFGAVGETIYHPL